jgi:hypothetical protein
VVVIEAVPQFVAEQHGSKFFLSSGDIADIAARMALLYGIIIAIIASPIWWVLGRVGRNKLIDATALGFLLTFASWCLTGYGSVTAVEFPLELARQSAIFGLAGAASGAVTWLAARSILRRRN